MSYREQYEEVKKAGLLKNMTPTYIEFKKKGDNVIGSFLGRSEVQSSSSDKMYYQYLFITDEGLVKFHMGRSADSEAGRLFRPDGVYRIEFEGKEKISGARAVNKFQIVEIAPGRDEDIAL